jgi:hypothetical protein
VSKSKVLMTVGNVRDAKGLKQAIDNLVGLVPTLVKMDEVLVFGENNEPLKLDLIEDTLTDGSKVYNLFVR